MVVGGVDLRRALVVVVLAAAVATCCLAASSSPEPPAAAPKSGRSGGEQLVAMPSSQMSLSAATNTPPRAYLAAAQSIASPKIQLGTADMTPAAGHHYSGKAAHGKYYMFTEVPKKGAYKAGFRRGNRKHLIERKESVEKGHASGYFKWHDKKGSGSHKWELKHYDKKAKHHY